MKTKQKIEIQWVHYPSKPIEEVRYTPEYNIGEKFVAVLPIGLVHKKTGIKIITRQQLKPGENHDNMAWFVVQGTNANNISYEYRYNAGIGSRTRMSPRNGSSIGYWGSQRWVENYINKNYILEGNE